MAVATMGVAAPVRESRSPLALSGAFQEPLFSSRRGSASAGGFDVLTRCGSAVFRAVVGEQHPAEQQIGSSPARLRRAGARVARPARESVDLLLLNPQSKPTAAAMTPAISRTAARMRDCTVPRSRSPQG